ncbi:trans-sulfuration enzyme family protein [Paenibacillus glycinis]|uniref:Cystathionine beta-lyase n=1 Tax=Paenibacillus glycinis TaxID=2697035 RepID=A0ABW9XN50_9BACL|nr:aminotransferase class I/II-fold pyridoxal phosphate-dependent enzyme [Paenibacillus glycinis]NBD24064.1 cystathionine beta-lyase [Paenibacillus glycinis]
MSNTDNNQPDRKRGNIEKQFTKTAYDPIDTRHQGAIHVPVYQNSLFAFETYEAFSDAVKQPMHNHVYSRGNNPTVEYLENKLADLEAAEAAKCFASGMGAITAAIMSFVAQGDHIVCVDQAYGPTKEFLSVYLSRFGVETTFVDGRLLENIREAVKPNTKLIYLESPTTMFFELQNLRECAEYARSIGIHTMIDNTWATPIYQNPLAHGVDLVVHSITKYIAGHSDCVGGVVLGSRELVDRIGNNEYMLFGAIMTPQAAALISKGLRTLPLRMQRHETSGLTVAEHVRTLPFVHRVNHPGLPNHPQHELAASQMSGYSSLFSFITQVPIETMKAWADKLKYFKIGVSWGGFESLVTVNPAGKQQEDGSLVRLYIGLESPQDLMADIDQASESLSLL